MFFGFRLVTDGDVFQIGFCFGIPVEESSIGSQGSLVSMHNFFFGEEHEKAGESRTVPHVFPVGLFAQA